MESCFNPLDALFLHSVFALDKPLDPINVDSFGLLSSPGFDMGELSREEEERAQRGLAFHLWASIELVGLRLCDNDGPLRWRCRQTGFWSRDVSDASAVHQRTEWKNPRKECIKCLWKICLPSITDRAGSQAAT